MDRPLISTPADRNRSEWENELIRKGEMCSECKSRDPARRRMIEGKRGGDEDVRLFECDNPFHDSVPKPNVAHEHRHAHPDGSAFHEHPISEPMHANGTLDRFQGYPHERLSLGHLIEIAEDWRYSDEFIGNVFRHRLKDIRELIEKENT